jgi:hypothetical protein
MLIIGEPSELRLEGEKMTRLTPLRHDSGQFVVWRLAKPHSGESCRWETPDGRWITLSLGQDEEIGLVVIADGGGHRQLLESYEDALDLAKEWQQ